jgi:hypothetical protein
MALTIEEAVWLKEVYDKEVHGRTLRGKAMAGYYEAERIMSGWDKPQIRGCSCQWRVVAMGVHALRQRHNDEINKLYDEYLQSKNTPKRGRKKASVRES